MKKYVPLFEEYCNKVNEEFFNKRGFSIETGLHKNGTMYDDQGFDKEGYNKGGFNKEGIHRNGTRYDDTGYDVKFNKNPELMNGNEIKSQVDTDDIIQNEQESMQTKILKRFEELDDESIRSIEELLNFDSIEEAVHALVNGLDCVFKQLIMKYGLLVGYKKSRYGYVSIYPSGKLKRNTRERLEYDELEHELVGLDGESDTFSCVAVPSFNGTYAILIPLKGYSGMPGSQLRYVINWNCNKEFINYVSGFGF